MLLALRNGMSVESHLARAGANWRRAYYNADGAKSPRSQVGGFSEFLAGEDCVLWCDVRP